MHPVDASGPESAHIAFRRSRPVEKINVARRARADGIILFSYDFTARPSELNPGADYLDRVRRGAFETTAAIK